MFVFKHLLKLTCTFKYYDFVPLRDLSNSKVRLWVEFQLLRLFKFQLFCVLNHVRFSGRKNDGTLTELKCTLTQSDAG
jgi:hypothetical protein